MTNVYRSKPQTVEAVQWTGTPESLDRIWQLFATKVYYERDGAADGLLLLAGQDGAQEWVPVPVGHWLVNQPGDKSHIWPVDPDYFANKYEPEGTP